MVTSEELRASGGGIWTSQLKTSALQQRKPVAAYWRGERMLALLLCSAAATYSMALYLISQ